jgi:hypothetical protein
VLRGVKISVGFEKRQRIAPQIGNGITIFGRIDTLWIRKGR